MKIQTVLCFLCGVYFNLSHAQFVKIDLKGHPWIPKKINWKEGSFETYYFYNDSCFVKITSTQSKIKNDSIIFMREPGYILHKGKYSINKENSLISLSYQLFYRTFKLTGELLPSISINEQINFISLQSKNVFKSKKILFLQTKKFTKQSLQLLYDLPYSTENSPAGASKNLK